MAISVADKHAKLSSNQCAVQSGGGLERGQETSPSSLDKPNRCESGPPFHVPETSVPPLATFPSNSTFTAERLGSLGPMNTTVRTGIPTNEGLLSVQDVDGMHKPSTDAEFSTRNELDPQPRPSPLRAPAGRPPHVRVTPHEHDQAPYEDPPMTNSSAPDACQLPPEAPPKTECGGQQGSLSGSFLPHFTDGEGQPFAGALNTPIKDTAGCTRTGIRQTEEEEAGETVSANSGMRIAKEPTECASTAAGTCELLTSADRTGEGLSAWRGVGVRKQEEGTANRGGGAEACGYGAGNLDHRAAIGESFEMHAEAGMEVGSATTEHCGGRTGTVPERCNTSSLDEVDRSCRKPRKGGCVSFRRALTSGDHSASHVGFNPRRAAEEEPLQVSQRSSFQERTTAGTLVRQPPGGSEEPHVPLQRVLSSQGASSSGGLLRQPSAAADLLQTAAGRRSLNKATTSGHADALCLVIIPKTPLLVVGDSEGRLLVWNTDSGALLHVLTPVSSQGASHNTMASIEKMVHVPGPMPGIVACASGEGRLHIVEVQRHVLLLEQTLRDWGMMAPTAIAINQAASLLSIADANGTVLILDISPLFAALTASICGLTHAAATFPLESLPLYSTWRASNTAIVGLHWLPSTPATTEERIETNQADDEGILSAGQDGQLRLWSSVGSELPLP
eukprot:jgi/Botrbrau1/10341/Bobra.0321s0016.1